MSQSQRAMTECIFRWGKQHGTMRKTKHRGIASVAADFLLNLIAYNLICIPQLVAAWVSGRAEHQKQLPKASAARTDHQKREQWLNF